MDQITHERDRSLRVVQIVFAILALLSLIAALAVSVRGIDFGLPETSVQTIAMAFLAVGILDTVLLFVWERIFQRMQP
ncbi:MAG: hypothetical protein K2X41_10965 [Hyphomicrobium sp.]|nr:hypothetical protein [Hyphomicrobium sp.]